MPLLKDENLPQIAFQASDIQATFPNGHQVDFTTEDIQAMKSPAGEDVIVLQQDDHLVRLYLTSPDRDWRANVTYSWQLSMAWMASDSTDNIQTTEWLHWNRENNVNSQIKGYRETPLFSTESITLHFYAFDRMPWGHTTKEPLPSTKIIMRNVLLGTHLQDDMALNKRTRPCPSAVCDIIDGVVTSKGNAVGGAGTTASHMLDGVPIYVVILAALVSSLFSLIAVIRRIQRNKKTENYAPVESDEDESGSSETEMQVVKGGGDIVEDEA